MNKRITDLGAQHWTCPFCRLGMGWPELTTCVSCGAIRDGDIATRKEPSADSSGTRKDAGHAGAVTAGDRGDPDADDGK